MTREKFSWKKEDLSQAGMGVRRARFKCGKDGLLASGPRRLCVPSPLSRAESVRLMHLLQLRGGNVGQDWAEPKGCDKGVRWLLGEGGGMRKFEAGDQLIICAFFFQLAQAATERMD